MNELADDTIKDIADATSDTTFERAAKEQVKLYRWGGVERRAGRRGEGRGVKGRGGVGRAGVQERSFSAVGIRLSATNAAFLPLPLRVSDASGMLEITEVGSYPLKCGLLDSNDAFILDTGASGIFVWVGRGATANEKKAAFKNATVRSLWVHAPRGVLFM